MSIESQLKLSYYQKIGYIDQKHDVHLVQHTESGRLFVMKTLKLYDLRVYQYIKNHPAPGLPYIEELIEDDGVLTVIEDYISGPSLRELLDTSGPFEETQVIDLIDQLCSILEPLHRLDPPIVHRDIKPANLILTRENKLTLIDFDSAKETSPNQNRDTVLIGTAGYAAPEQYGFSSSQSTADIYAIGILMRELLTGSIENGTEVSEPLQSIIQRCTQMDPKFRYQSVEMIQYDLAQKVRLPIPKKPAKANDASAQKAPSKATGLRSWLPPGFRSGNPFIAILAAIGYIYLIFLCFSITLEDISSLELFLDRALTLFMFLLMIFYFADYKGMRSRLPLCRSKERLVRIVGNILWTFIYFFAAFLMGFTFIETILTL